MDPQQLKSKLLHVVRRLTDTQREASRVSVDALRLKDGASHEQICALAIGEALANRVIETVTVGWAALGLSPSVPNDMSDDNVVAAFSREASLASSRLGLSARHGDGSSAPSPEQYAGCALVVQAEELLALARQALARASFYVTRAAVLQDAEKHELCDCPGAVNARQAAAGNEPNC